MGAKCVVISDYLSGQKDITDIKFNQTMDTFFQKIHQVVEDINKKPVNLITLDGRKVKTHYQEWTSEGEGFSTVYKWNDKVVTLEEKIKEDKGGFFSTVSWTSTKVIGYFLSEFKLSAPKDFREIINEKRKLMNILTARNDPESRIKFYHQYILRESYKGSLADTSTPEIVFKIGSKLKP